MRDIKDISFLNEWKIEVCNIIAKDILSVLIRGCLWFCLNWVLAFLLISLIFAQQSL